MVRHLVGVTRAQSAADIHMCQESSEEVRLESRHLHSHLNSTDRLKRQAYGDSQSTQAPCPSEFCDKLRKR